MNDKFMFKLAQIRSSYTRKRFGTINNEEKALIDYETFCLELIKEIDQLKQQRQELRSWLEEQWEQSQDIWFVKIINKINELENKSAENGKNVQ